MKRLLLVGLVVLAGCSTKSMNEMNYSELKAYAVEMQTRCEKQGVKGDQEMKACINQEAMADQSRRQRQKQFGAALAGASQAYGNSMQRSAAVNRPVTCNSTGNSSWVGGPINSVRTTCY